MLNMIYCLAPKSYILISSQRKAIGKRQLKALIDYRLKQLRAEEEAY